MEAVPNSLKLPENLSVLDRGQLRILFSPDNEDAPNIISAFADLYEQEHAARLEKWKEICARCDNEALREEAHYLAGSSMNLGLQRVGTLCRNIESAIKEKNFDAFGQCYEIVKREFDAGVKALRVYVKETNSHSK